ncbi:cation diffusion facilitator family transporter [Lyngbya confervoides]|uniref:Cation diffusion facilitator family transporter n=1 Tax=Lyngbya confervoides BDU141951 TaxID=1574623 RepID=A0ABD4T721_9CYAN|nr:cation diffusion facilitator family transporter [Lyngbya confervoides]MCM1984528.1 cation diffusion facilitator family transporter [Lyngbya confervoides BDU141951]
MPVDLTAPEAGGEKFALRLSLFGSLGATILAFAFAFGSRSGAIMLDGFYSLVTLSMSLLTLKVADLLERGRSPQYQFGYYGFEPLINTIKGIIVLSVTLFALVSAVEALIYGGRPLEVGSAFVFALLSTVICAAMGLTLSRFAHRLQSPLLAVDARDWRIDTLISGAIAIAFGLGWMMSGTAWVFLVPYIDPLLVTVLALVVVPIPVRTVLEGVNQLLAGAPDPELETAIRSKLQQVCEDYPICQTEVQMAQIGRVLCVSVQVLVPGQYKLTHVPDLDQIRERFTQVIQAAHPHTDIDICFTGDEQWLKGEPYEDSADLT